MTIRERFGNLLAADTEAIVNTVNCVGFMGKGIALQFRKAWPENFRAYQQKCRAHEVVPGRMFVFDTGGAVNPRFIINFPTKRHWRGRSRIEDIAEGLNALVSEVRARRIRSIAIPALGCGNGGLEWSAVRPLIEAAFRDERDVEVVLYPPQPSPQIADQIVGPDRPTMSRGRALLVALLDRYTALGESTSLLEIQKLAYFLQEAGESLRLDFQPAQYGPYAERLSKVLADMEGHFTIGFDGSRRPRTPIEVVPAAVEEALQVIEADSDVKARLDRVAALIEGFESPYGMELLATTHWVISRAQRTLSDSEVVASVHSWSNRKAHLFQQRHVSSALARLIEKGWVSTARRTIVEAVAT